MSNEGFTNGPTPEGERLWEQFSLLIVVSKYTPDEIQDAYQRIRGIEEGVATLRVKTIKERMQKLVDIGYSFDTFSQLVARLRELQQDNQDPDSK